MSDLSLTMQGKMSPAEFITKAVAELKALEGLPWFKSLAAFVISLLYGRIQSVLGPMIAALICHEIEAALGLPTDPAITQTNG